VAGILDGYSNMVLCGCEVLVDVLNRRMLMLTKVDPQLHMLWLGGIDDICRIATGATRISLVRETCPVGIVIPHDRDGIIGVELIDTPVLLNLRTSIAVVGWPAWMTDSSRRRRRKKPAGKGLIETGPCLVRGPVLRSWVCLAGLFREIGALRRGQQRECRKDGLV
jgi:hypothetical protein